MREILLTKGRVALVDDEDFERVNQYKWRAVLVNNKLYASGEYRKRDGSVGNRRMHRFILSLPAGRIPLTDHRDGNGLNNQKSNIRVATSLQNNRNARKRSDNSSGFKGVSLYKPYDKWRATIRVNGVKKHLGYFSNPKDAALAYDKAARKFFGDFALLNFNSI